mgnify:CR=1 FL=1
MRMAGAPRIGFDRASVQAFLRDDRTPTVYRIYTSDGRLLACGSTCWQRSRMLDHLRDPAMADGAWVTLTTHRSIKAMLAGEREAAGEQPIVASGVIRRHHAWKKKPVTA